MSGVAGISTVGVKVGYAVETTAGTKPAKFKQIHRINATDDIGIDTETIDASALEDEVDKEIAGRGSTGGTFNVTVNLTNETIKEWETLISEYKAGKTAGKAVWYEEYYPALDKAYFTKIEPPARIPKPGLDQNGLATVEMTLTINEYVGLDTAVEPDDTEV